MIVYKNPNHQFNASGYDETYTADGHHFTHRQTFQALHDLATAAPGTHPHRGYNPPDEYAKNLRRIIEMINIAGVQTTIWALNTPIHDQWQTTDRKMHRLNQDVILYNQIAAEVMAELDVPINDLSQPMMRMGLERCLMRDGVHLRHEGSTLLGKIVANRISQYC